MYEGLPLEMKPSILASSWSLHSRLARQLLETDKFHKYILRVLELVAGHCILYLFDMDSGSSNDHVERGDSMRTPHKTATESPWRGVRRQTHCHAEGVGYRGNKSTWREKCIPIISGLTTALNQCKMGAGLGTQARHQDSHTVADCTGDVEQNGGGCGV